MSSSTTAEEVMVKVTHEDHKGAGIGAESPRRGGAPRGNSNRYHGGRRYPRKRSEVGERVAGTSLARFAPGLAELRAQAIEDLGDHASALRVELLDLAIRAEAVALALLREIETKAEASIRAGHIPNPSRYAAVKLLPVYLGTITTMLHRIGLKRERKPAGLSGYLEQRASSADAAPRCAPASPAEQPGQPTEGAS